MLSSSGSSPPRDRTWVSCIAGRFLLSEPPWKPLLSAEGLTNTKGGKNQDEPCDVRLETVKKQGIGINTQFSVCSVQFSHSVVSNSVTPWTAACQASLSIINSQSLLKLMSIESVMLSNHLIPCCPLLLLPSVFPSIKVFSNESVFRIRWSKYWSFSFNISLSNKYLGLISFRMDWLDLLAVQGTLKSLLQHHSSKASILQCSAFFIV